MPIFEYNCNCSSCKSTFSARVAAPILREVKCPKCDNLIFRLRTYKGFIYILSNPLMPDVTKIGQTERDVYERARELEAVTGVPTAFCVEAFYESDDPSSDERVIHQELSSFRVNKNREFFRLSPQAAIIRVTEILKRHPAIKGYGENQIFDFGFDDSIARSLSTNDSAPPSLNCAVCGRAFTRKGSQREFSCPSCGATHYAHQWPIKSPF